MNENATIADFNNLDDLLTRLTAATEITKDIRALFNSKNGYIFVAAFKKFTELGREDKEFGMFLHWFLNAGNETEIDGKNWNELNKSHSTRDSSVVHGKLDYLVELTRRYFVEDRKAA